MIIMIWMMMMTMRRRSAMVPQELQEIVEQMRFAGTDLADVEAKRAGTDLPKSVRETVSAFQNTQGGVVILGLEETSDFSATGVANPSKMASDLESLLSVSMEPPVRALIEIHQFEGVALVTAEIPALDPSQRPCHYKGAGMTRGSYIRVNDADIRLSNYEVQMMIASRGQPIDDQQPVMDAGLEDLGTESRASLLGRLRQNRPRVFSDLSDTEALRRAGALVKVGETLYPTVAGLVALGDFPQQFFPQLMLTFVHYPTPSGPEITGARFLDSVALEGPLPVIVRDALAVLRRNMSRRSTVAGAGRSDAWEYPETALREAIVNALVHRDLSPVSRGTQVQVEMYPDRLVVRNPGGLFGPISLQDLGSEEHMSSSRNATLLRLLEDVTIPGEDRTVCENRGSGIRSMQIALRSAGMSIPLFEDRVSSFQVTFPNHALLGDATVKWIGDLGENGLTDSQVIALATLKEGRILDNSTYRAATGIDSRVATAELQDLVARELVVQSGSRRWAAYGLHERVTRSPGTTAGRRLSPADRRQQILDALGENVLSRAEIAQASGLSDQVVLRWLGILRKSGHVERSGGQGAQSRHTRYRRLRRLDDYLQESFGL